MKITHITIKDWGPHKEIDIDTNASIVGVIGANGTGKSNLLQAIDFGLSGNLNKQNKELYIRNYGSANAASRASVYLEFEKNGLKGSIYREIRKGSTKRLLKWDGHEYKSDSEVASKMEEILGADKNAMANAVFIKQGDITNLVKGTPSVRQEIFQKLMKLSFLNSRELDIKNAIDKIRGNIVDLSPVIDNYNLQMRNLEERVAEIRATLMLKEDHSEDIRTLEEMADTMKIISDMQTASIANKEALSRANSDMATLGDYDSTVAKVNNLKEEVDNRMAIVDLAQRKISDKTILQSVVSAEGNIIKELEAVENTDSINTLKEELNQVLAWQENLKLYNTAKAQRDAVADRLNSVKENLTKLLKQYAKFMDNHSNKVSSLNSEKIKYSEQKTVAKCRLEFYSGSDSSGICPICGNKYSGSSDKEEIIAEATKLLEEANSNLERIHDEQAQEEKQKTELSNSISAYTSRAEELEQSFRELTNKFNATKLPESFNERDLCSREHELSVRISDLEKAKVNRDKLEAKLRAYEEQEKQLVKSLEKYPTLEEENTKSIYKIKDDNLSIVDNLKNEIKTLETTINNMNIVRGRIDTLTAAQNEIDIKLSEQRSYLSTNEDFVKVTDKFFTVPGSTVAPTVDRDAVINKIGALRVEQDTRKYHLRLKEEKLSEKETLNTLWEEAVERQNKNQKIIDLVNDLTVARKVVSSSGLPMAYMNSVFHTMTKYVQELLTQMGANFTVFPDEDKPITFKFMRTDSDSEHYMPQELLSGGQAVRLALALLIACQRMVLPDVGLLVLDEPSSHLDAEGVDSLQDLFKTLGASLSSSDMQIFVVDHSEPLCGAFEKLITIS